MSYKDQILNEITIIFRKELDEPALVVGFNDSAHTIEKWDSINNLMLISAIEEKYNLSMPVDVIFRLEKVGDICDYIVENTTPDKV